MANGFTDDEGRFRPFSKTGVGKSKKEKTVTTGKGKLITKQGFEFTPRERGVTWETAVERFVEFRDDNSDLEGFTFDPEINEGFDFEDADRAIDFHDFYVEGGEKNPVFLIGVTNQLGGTPTRELQSAYEQIKSERRNVFLGYFKDDLDNEFTDISFPLSDIPREEALQIAKEFAQDNIAVVFDDGTFSIETVR